MHTRRLVIALLAGGLIGSGITLGVEKLHEPDFTLTSTTYGGSTMEDAVPGKTYTFDSGDLCVSGSYAKLTAVRPRKPEGGIKVLGFSVRESTMLGTPTEVVTDNCKDDKGDGQHLFVEVRSDKFPAAANGYIVDYVIDGQKKTTLNTNYGLLCDSTKKDQDGVIYGKITPKCYE